MIAAQHTLPQEHEIYRECNAETAVIPGSCTKYFQPLDATVIYSFKRKYEPFRIDSQLDKVAKKSNDGSIKPLNRQNNFDIVSKGLMVESAISKSFDLCGVNGVYNPNFMRHELQTKKKLKISN